MGKQDKNKDKVKKSKDSNKKNEVLIEGQTPEESGNCQNKDEKHVHGKWCKFKQALGIKGNKSNKKKHSSDASNENNKSNIIIEDEVIESDDDEDRDTAPKDDGVPKDTKESDPLKSAAKNNELYKNSPNNQRREDQLNKIPIALSDNEEDISYLTTKSAGNTPYNSEKDMESAQHSNRRQTAPSELDLNDSNDSIDSDKVFTSNDKDVTKNTKPLEVRNEGIPEALSFRRYVLEFIYYLQNENCRKAFAKLTGVEPGEKREQPLPQASVMSKKKSLDCCEDLEKGTENNEEEYLKNIDTMYLTKGQESMCKNIAHFYDPKHLWQDNYGNEAVQPYITSLFLLNKVIHVEKEEKEYVSQY